MLEASVIKADQALRSWCAENLSAGLETLDWNGYSQLISTINQANQGFWPKIHTLNYIHPVALQDSKFGVGKPYSVPVVFSDSGNQGDPLLAVGGLTNVIQRFDFLSIDAAPALRVIGMDLVGRGQSGWMVDISDYKLETYAEQVIQLANFLGLDRFSMLGSSLGGTIAIRLAAAYPHRVRRIILNDIGPFIPAERRSRRSVAVARHYVFSDPVLMFRRTGAAVKHTGPAPDAMLLHAAHHKTRWSNTEKGRIYRHDLRCLLAYRAEAQKSLDQWNDWKKIECPVLFLRGMYSDATSDFLVERMRSHQLLSVLEIEDAGHTPALADKLLINSIVDWNFRTHPYKTDRRLKFEYNPKRILFPQ